MPINLRIGLVQSSPNQAYYSGSTITGSLMLDVDEPKSYNQILIQFSGRSHVYWTESRTEGSGDNQRTVTDTYTSTEPYIDLTVPLWNSHQSPDRVLPVGQYSWPFSFTIPPTAPASYEGTVGNIRYSLVGKTGLLKFNKNVELRIPVQQLVKITDPRLLQPVRQDVQKRVCCLCCASGPIVLTVAVPKTGFCVGDSFQLHTSLENGSNRRLTMIAAITQLTLYLAQGNRNHSSKTILSVGSDEIEPQATRNWDPTIQIPTSGIDIIRNMSCRNIKISYYLDLTCRIPRAINLRTGIPLQFGNCRDEQQPPIAPALQPGPPPMEQPTAAYPPSAPAPGGQYQPPQTMFPPTAAPATASPQPSQAGPPPPPYGAVANVGWPTEPHSDFPPSNTQQPLTDFSAKQIEKGFK